MLRARLARIRSWLSKRRAVEIAAAGLVGVVIATFIAAQSIRAMNAIALAAVAAPLIGAGVWLFLRHTQWVAQRTFNRLREIAAAVQAVLLGGILIGVGFKLEPIISGTGTGASPSPLYEIQLHPVAISADIFVVALTIGVSISALALGYSLSYRRRIHRLLAASLTVPVVLGIIDTSLHLFAYFEYGELYVTNNAFGALIFSYMCDLFGGAIAGFIVYRAFTSGLNYSRGATDRSIIPNTLRNVVLGVVSVVMFFATVYFLVIHRMPHNVALQLKGWNELHARFPNAFLYSTLSDRPEILDFRFVSRHISYRPSEGQESEIVICSDPPVCPTVSFVIRGVDPDALMKSGDSALVDVGGRLNPRSDDIVIDNVEKIVVNGVNEVHVARPTREKVHLLSYLELPLNDSITFAKRRESHSFMNVILDMKRSNDPTLSLEVRPATRRILLSGGATSTLLLAFSPAYDLDPFYARTGDLDRLLTMVARMRFSIVSSTGAKTDLTVGDFIGQSQSSRSLLLPMLEIRELSNTSMGFEARGIRSVRLQEPLFSLMHLGMISAQVSELSSDQIEGTLKVGNIVSPIEMGDRVFLGAADLFLTDDAGDKPNIVGKSRYISVNGEILNDTVLSALPSEVTGSIVGSGLAFLLTSYLSRRSRRRRL